MVLRVDESGTDSQVFSARDSLARTQINGSRLAMALVEACGGQLPRVQLIGYTLWRFGRRPAGPDAEAVQVGQTWAVSTVSLHTERLLIRAFTDEDTPTIHRVLDLSFGDGSLVDDAAALEDRRSWVAWQALNDRWFPRMFQPPYGDRAVVATGSGELVGSVGYVPVVGPFDQLPGLRSEPAGEGSIPSSPSSGRSTPTIGGSVTPPRLPAR